jgi:hypothetical protein
MCCMVISGLKRVWLLFIACMWLLICPETQTDNALEAKSGKPHHGQVLGDQMYLFNPGWSDYSNIILHCLNLYLN